MEVFKKSVQAKRAGYTIRAACIPLVGELPQEVQSVPKVGSKVRKNERKKM